MRTRTDAPPPVMQQYDIPDAIRALVPDADYVDLFVGSVRGAAPVPPEAWARTAIEHASRAGRYLAWELVLRLRLDAPPSPEHIAGWQVVDRRDSSITLRATSWFMTAHMVFHVDAERLSFATFVHYDRPPARAIWTAVSVVHRAVAPDFVRAAVVRQRKPTADRA